MKKPVNKISVFNLIKGIGILLVIWDHGKEPFLNLYTGFPYLIILLIDTFTRYSLMALFFMLSGYFTRKQTVEKYLKHQVNLILKPYFLTACVTVVCVFIRNLISHHITLRTIKETVKTVLGFMLGVSPGGLQYFGLQYSDCGPMWFLLALMIGTAMFLWTLNHIDEKKHLWIISGAFMAVIPLLFAEAWFPFSLIRGIFAYVNVFLGYSMKKQKLLDKPLAKYHWILGAMCFLGNLAVNMGYVANRLFQFIFCGFGAEYIAFLTVYLFCYFGDKENWLTDKLEYIGQNSLIFFCVHTVENKSLPWGKLSNLLLAQPVLGTIAVFALKVSICAAGSALVLNRKTLWKKIYKV